MGVGVSYKQWGWVSLMSEVPLQRVSVMWPEHTDESYSPLEKVVPPLPIQYRGYSKLRTRTAPRKVLCS